MAGKPKQKKKSNPEFEFIAPYPPDVCAAKLQELNGWRWKRLNRTQVMIQRIDRETWEFILYRSHFRSPYIEWGNQIISIGSVGAWYFKVGINGRLKTSQDRTTLVIGSTITHRKTFWVNGVWFFVYSPFILLVTVLFWEVSWILALIMIVIFAAIIGLTVWLLKETGEEYCFELQRELKTQLTPPKNQNP